MKKIIACALAVAAISFTAPQAFAKGSLAVNKKNPIHFGWAVDKDSYKEADAIEHCTGDCEVVYQFEHTCAAFASEPGADGATGWAHRETADEAKEAAVHECRKVGGEGCEVRVWGCDE